MGSLPIFATTYALDWGWLRIGPPYIYINIDPVMFHIGPLAIRWYGLMYAIAIVLALVSIRGYLERKGLNQTVVSNLLWWCIPIGLIGGRLYFVVQQPDLFSYYLPQPLHIIATWEGGMAFFGAIFLVIPTLFWRSRVERINPLVAIDAGVLFAAVGQIFGRIGNLINGDIIGYPSKLPWSTVYQNPGSWACLNQSTCNIPVQPAAAYELLTNLALVALLFYLARRVTRPGILMLVYLFGYAITQFLLFFARDNVIVSFLGLNWGLKQAQWTAIVLFIALLPITYLVLRSSKPIPEGEVAATYGIPQKEEKKPLESTEVAEEPPVNEQEEVAAEETEELPMNEQEENETVGEEGEPLEAQTNETVGEEGEREEPLEADTVEKEQQPKIVKTRETVPDVPTSDAHSVPGGE